MMGRTTRDYEDREVTLFVASKVRRFWVHSGSRSRWLKKREKGGL